jgi:ribosomal protein L7Ae-like RNA K-turn-binding protein
VPKSLKSLLMMCVLPAASVLLDPLQPQPRQRRLYVCGLRESCKAIKCGTALAVLLAPDILVEQHGKSKPDRVLDGRMHQIISASQGQQTGRAHVPVVFALSRKKIGQVFGSKKRMSAVTLLDVTGVEEMLGVVLQLADEGRQSWMGMHHA